MNYSGVGTGDCQLVELIINYPYAIDDAGNVQADFSVGTATFTYDGNNQLNKIETPGERGQDNRRESRLP